MKRQTGKSPDGLDGPPMPESVAYLWRWFRDLHMGRSVTGMGLMRATHQDIWSWQQNFGIRAAQWELRALMSLGVVWMNVMSEETVKIVGPSNG